MITRKNTPLQLVGLAVTLLFLIIPFIEPYDFTEFVEMKTFDLRSRLTAPRERHPDVELVIISERELEEFGPWPWSRDIFAQAVTNLALAGARVIALNIEFREPEGNPGLRAVKDLKENYDNLGLAQKGPGLTFYQKLTQAEQDLDNDMKLYNAIKKAGNVVLPIHFDLSGDPTYNEAPDFIIRHSFKLVEGLDDESATSRVTWLKNLSPFLPSLAEVTASIGHNNFSPDRDGVIRSQEHALGYLKDILLPSYPIAIARIFYGLKDEDIKVILNEGIDLKVNPSSSLKVPVTDNSMKTLMAWHSGPGIAFHWTPFLEIYKNQIQTSLFKDKVVIIGPTAAVMGEGFVTPISGQLPGVELVANSVANVIDQRFLQRPGWVFFLEVVLLIIFGFFISMILPQLRQATGAIVTLALLLCFGGISTLLLFSQDIWIKIGPHLMLLVLGYILITATRRLIKEKTLVEAAEDSADSNRIEPLSSQGQDMDDLDNSTPWPEKAYVGPVQRSGGGLPKRAGSLISGYKVIDELGRGSIEVIYKGMESRSRRAVVIETVSFSEFSEEMLDEIRGSFFKAVRSVRSMTHPNLVEIYDAGEEQDLIYVVTELLDGESLSGYTKDNLLSLREALSITAAVADVLDFAHERGIVHSGIRPSCIMRLEETGEVKVTDFIMAGIKNDLKRKNGVISDMQVYMSPEQAMGKKVDHRSDIFSLGVVLFELLSGTRPFSGEDMESLIDNIVKKRHPPLRSINPTIPGVVAKIIDRSLAKERDRRYQAAKHMAEHLKKVVAKIDEIQGKRRSRRPRESSVISAQGHQIL